VYAYCRVRSAPHAAPPADVNSSPMRPSKTKVHAVYVSLSAVKLRTLDILLL